MIYNTLPHYQPPHRGEDPEDLSDFYGGVMLHSPRRKGDQVCENGNFGSIYGYQWRSYRYKLINILDTYFDQVEHQKCIGPQ